MSRHRIRRVAGGLALVAVLAAVVVGGSADAAAKPTGSAQIDILTFNVLGPLWASPTWYPEIDEPALLDTEYRRERLTSYLQSVRSTAELVCLQEVAASELPYLAAALGPGFTGAMSFNDPSYWSNWIVPPIEWEPNGTAVFARRDAFSDITVADRALGTGNHAAELTATHKASGRPVHVWSVHLDSDREKNRAREIDAVLAATPASASTIDVICGDINEDTQTGTVAGITKRAGFTDVLAAVGVRTATHPWSTSYNKSKRWAIIDHVMVRGATPSAGLVEDAGVASIADESERIEEYLRRMGSDHYAVLATVTTG